MPAARMPVIFFGHGNPMNAIQENDYTTACNIGKSIPRPRSILSISAHWYLPAPKAEAQRLAFLFSGEFAQHAPAAERPADFRAEAR